MTAQQLTQRVAAESPTDPDRARLLADISVQDRLITLDGIKTAVIEGGPEATDQPPLLLVTGQGESAVWWVRVLPALVRERHVVAPDLPGHGASELPEGRLDERRLFAWLDALLDTLPRPPVVVGHVLGGALALRYAAARPGRIERIVLVDSLGLRFFRPRPGFAFRMVRFMRQANARNYERFLDHCMYDQAVLRRGLAERWEPFLAYNLTCANQPRTQAAMRALMPALGVPRIPSATLRKVEAPTALIWGRHDRATSLATAEAASRRFGWPLHVIEESGDDPKLEQPKAFLAALAEAIRP